MKVQIWSDIACPFCYIGKKHLELAAEQTDTPLEIEWMSFQLDPSAPEKTDKSIYEILATKYGKDITWAKQMNANMIEMGEKAGLTFNVDIQKPTNTLKAHLLLHQAKEEGVQTKLKEALFEAYFVNGENISDTKTLLKIADKVGIDAEKAEEVLSKKEHTSEVKDDINLAQRYGVQGVPFFILNNKYAFSGAQPVEAFVQAFDKIAEEIEASS
ncbi:MAG: DsbA family oxidoreductase [Balneola sp.]|jgi:predicted DsbA family dithiol-disulfide isomerase